MFWEYLSYIFVMGGFALTSGIIIGTGMYLKMIAARVSVGVVIYGVVALLLIQPWTWLHVAELYRQYVAPEMVWQTLPYNIMTYGDDIMFVIGVVMLGTWAWLPGLRIPDEKAAVRLNAQLMIVAVFMITGGWAFHRVFSNEITPGMGRIMMRATNKLGQEALVDRSYRIYIREKNQILFSRLQTRSFFFFEDRAKGGLAWSENSEYLLARSMKWAWVMRPGSDEVRRFELKPSGTLRVIQHQKEMGPISLYISENPNSIDSVGVLWDGTTVPRIEERTLSILMWMGYVHVAGEIDPQQKAILLEGMEGIQVSIVRR